MNCMVLADEMCTSEYVNLLWWKVIKEAQVAASCMWTTGKHCQGRDGTD
jgi:hypothetical protein